MLLAKHCFPSTNWASFEEIPYKDWAEGWSPFLGWVYFYLFWKSLSSHFFYISHQWRLRMTEIAQCVGVNSSPGDWSCFIIAEENKNLLSLEKWTNWYFPAKVDEFPSCSSHSWEALLLTFPCRGEALFCPYYQLTNKTSKFRKGEEREKLFRNIFKGMSFPVEEFVWWEMDLLLQAPI